MKIHEVLYWGSKALNDSSTPNLDSELILAKTLNVDRVFLFSNYNFELSEEEIALFFLMIKNRAIGMPVAHMTQTKDFWNSSFFVNKHTLVPRPDSETLIVAFNDIFKNRNVKLKMLELGTGSCCILISIINEYKNVIGYGVEKMQKAFHVSMHNVTCNKSENRIKMFYCNWNNFHLNVSFDVIISNPPYIKRGEIENLSKEVAKYEPRVALDGGITGLSAYSEIFKLSTKFLKRGGIILLEIGRLQHKQIAIVGQKFGFSIIKHWHDLGKVIRVIALQKNR